MAKKPTSYTDWTESGGAGYRSEPTAPHKAVGWTYEEKPVWEEMNWIQWCLGRWGRWISDFFLGYVAVGSGSDVDYSDINSAIAGGNTKIILISDITVGVLQDFTPSKGILKTNGFKIINSAGIAVTGVLKISGSDNLIEVDIDCTQAGPTTPAGLLVAGDSNDVKAKVIQSGVAGVITDAIKVAGDGNKINGFIGLTGAGTIGTGIRFDASSEGNQCDLVMNRKIGTFTATYADAGTANDFRISDII